MEFEAVWVALTWPQAFVVAVVVLAWSKFKVNVTLRVDDRPLAWIDRVMTGRAGR
jgi:hypothetical protein